MNSGYTINYHLDCNSRNVYLISCKVCGVVYSMYTLKKTDLCGRNIGVPKNCVISSI